MKEGDFPLYVCARATLPRWKALGEQSIPGFKKNEGKAQRVFELLQLRVTDPCMNAYSHTVKSQLTDRLTRRR